MANKRGDAAHGGNQRGSVTQSISGNATNCVQIASETTDGGTVVQSISGDATNCVQAVDVQGGIHFN